MIRCASLLAVLVLYTVNSGGHTLPQGKSSSRLDLPSLQELEQKLNLIIDTESREQELLDRLLLKEKLLSAVKSSNSGISNLAKRPTEEATKENNNISEESTTTTTTIPAFQVREEAGNDDDSGRTLSGAADGSSSNAAAADGDVNPTLRIEEDHGRNHNNDNDGANQADERKSRNPKDSSLLIVKKLEHNAKRMDTMVVFLADLRNVLSQAVASQQNQQALRGEVVELREEIENLRQEVEVLRKAQDHHGHSSDSPGTKLDNKIHNDEATIAWLKDSVEELRHGMEEISSSVNVTGMAHLQQHWSSEMSRVQGDVKSLQADLDSVKVSQARQLESSVEMKGDIADIRTWQIKMGQKFLEEEQRRVIQNEDNSSSFSQENRLDDAELMIKQRQADSTTKRGRRRVTRAGEASSTTWGRHQRKLKSQLNNLETVIRNVIKDDALLHKRLVKLEKKFASSLLTTGSAGFNSEDNSISNNNNNEDSSRRWGLAPGVSYSSRTKVDNGLSDFERITVLERSLSDYANTLEDVSDKVDSLTHLRESTVQLFTSLEALESKYDERLTEMQTSLSRMDASVSKASITNDELLEQQNLQTRVVRTLRKDFLITRDQVNTNHLRLAAVQSQFLKWGLQTCSDLSKESIQNIKIASLEARLQALTSAT